jgi:cobalt-zinc-cadmium resistance protein CzcA
MSGVIAFALKQRVIMLVLFVATVAGGVIAFWQLNIEAYPDPTPPMVDVITQSRSFGRRDRALHHDTD